MTGAAVPGVALAVLLDRLGEEAGGLALAIGRAETALQAVLQDLRGLPPGIGGDLQQIDLVRQSLEDFARLLWIAAAAAPPDRLVTAAGIRSAATLTGLAARLATGLAPAPGSAPGPVAAAGEEEDLLLF